MPQCFAVVGLSPSQGTVVACDLPGRFPVAPGRSGFEFIARLVELEHFAGSVPEMNPDPYTGASLNPQPLEKIGRIGSAHRFTSKAQFSAIQPYRSLATSRLKISGTGLWPLADFLDGILWLPYQEPLVLEHHQDVVWSGPDLKGESKEENLGSCVFGIARVCLHCSMSLILQVLSAVFSMPIRMKALTVRLETEGGSMEVSITPKRPPVTFQGRPA